MVEGEIVAEQDEAVGRRLQERHQAEQGVDVLAVDLDQLQRCGGVFARRVDAGMHRLHQRGLAHAAGLQNVVSGRYAMAFGVVEKNVAHAVDTDKYLNDDQALFEKSRFLYFML